MNINYDEILRYLGYRGKSADMEILKQIENCAVEIEGLLGSRTFVYSVFDIRLQSDTVVLENSVVALEGHDISEHLNGCSKCAMMAVTLGVGVERKLAYYSRFDLARALVMDAVASSMVESICDEVQMHIKEMAENNGFMITERFSPGYGDLSLQHQNSMLRVLDTERQLGLTVTDTNLLIPRKSVTAVIGLFKEKQQRTNRVMGLNGTGGYAIVEAVKTIEEAMVLEDTKPVRKAMEITEVESKSASNCSIRNKNHKCNTCNMKNCRFRKVGTENE